MHLVYAILVCFFIPESLFPYQMAASCARRQEEELARLEGGERGCCCWPSSQGQEDIWFLKPACHISAYTHERRESSEVPEKRLEFDTGGRCIRVHDHAHGGYPSVSESRRGLILRCDVQSSHTYKFQYAASTFHWSSEMVRCGLIFGHPCFELISVRAAGLLHQSHRRLEGRAPDANSTMSVQP
jgi:hypothetical protein